MSGLTPLRAAGLLRTFADAGVLSAADVHVASALSRLGAEPADDVLLAAALAVRGVRTGSVCVDLATVADAVLPAEPEEAEPASVALPWPEPRAWSAALERSPLVAVGAQAPWRPLRLVEGLLYLDRYWQQEQLVRGALDERAARPGPAVDLASLPQLFPDPPPDRQRLAAAVAAVRWTSVLTGGPGTGKTHTVARLLRLLHDQPGPPPRVALAAPTGKAAARLQESVREQSAALGLPDDLPAFTLHRLLGWRPDSRSRFRHDAAHHLPYDVVVVDESSMVSLTLMARLLEAVRPTARLVLVGDPDQLTPVDAGAVLADLVHRPASGPARPELPHGLLDADLELDDDERRQLRNGVVRLRTSHRYGPEIGALAEAVRAGRDDEVLALLTDGESVRLEPDVERLRAEVAEVGALLRDAATAGDARRALQLLGRHRLLCAHRRGPYGVARWNDVLAGWTGAPPRGRHPGQPLIVTANDYENGLYNGDTGVVLADGDGLRAAFAPAEQPLLRSLSRLGDVETAHALTVHRSQGSQYDAVTVLLPPAGSPLLTRELLYTAVTRARRRVRVVGDAEAVRVAVGRQVVRASGLRRVAAGPAEPSGEPAG